MLYSLFRGKYIYKGSACLTFLWTWLVTLGGSSLFSPQFSIQGSFWYHYFFWWNDPPYHPHACIYSSMPTKLPFQQNHSGKCPHHSMRSASRIRSLSDLSTPTRVNCVQNNYFGGTTNDLEFKGTKLLFAGDYKRNLRDRTMILGGPKDTITSIWSPSHGSRGTWF